MNWEAVGSVGDAVGGMGVLITLIYLAHQTRENTRAVRAASFHQVAASFSEVSLAVTQDPSLVALIRRVSADDPDLDQDERARFGFFLTTFVRRAESMFFQARQGTLEAESWRGIQQTLDNLLATNLARDWWSANSNRFNSEFQRFVQQELMGQDSSALRSWIVPPSAADPSTTNSDGGERGA